MLDIDTVYEKTVNVPMDEYIEGRILKSKVEIMLQAMEAGIMTEEMMHIIFGIPTEKEEKEGTVPVKEEKEPETPKKPARGGQNRFKDPDRYGKGACASECRLEHE